MGTITLINEQIREELRKVRLLSIVPYASLLLIYVWLRIVNISSIEEVKTFPDSVVFLDMASKGLLDPGLFWGGIRPFAVPLIYKLLGGDLQIISIFQSGLSILAWTLLAACVAREIRLCWLKENAALELAPIGWKLFALGNSPSDQATFHFSLTHSLLLYWRGLLPRNQGVAVRFHQHS